MVVYLSLETGILARSLFGIWSEGTLDMFELLAFQDLAFRTGRYNGHCARRIVTSAAEDHG